uniref:ATP synthase complex subunit 8 n=1 Tax=Negastrius sabulicola TaxID=1368518 RepID=A0A343C4Z6_9COLE|nr:ATP synthase F0 subunit 8 [Negastrius sabulicola]
MPQMAPLSWINLFIIFIMTFMFMNALNYFSFNYKNNLSSHTTKIKLINWKW